jgi:hypothetical protein
MTYARIPVFGGQFTHLYKETKLEFIVSDPRNPSNHPVYIFDQDLGNFILSIEDDIVLGIDESSIEEKIETEENKKKMYIALVCGRCFLTAVHLTLEPELGNSLWPLIINS